MAGKIVSIHSFRGGTGKSNTTANLAAQAALAGHRVGVVDTDIQSPGIHVLFGLDAGSMGHTMNDYLYGKCEIRDVAYPVGEHAAGAEGRAKLAGKTIWLFPSSIETKEITRVLHDGYSAQRLNEGLNKLIKEFQLDYLFIDTHPGLNDETMLSVAMSDVLVILMRPDEQDFQGTAVTVDLARGLDVPHLFIAVNKALPGSNDQVRERVQKKFNTQVAGIMPLNFELAALASSDLFSLKFPTHLWSVGLRDIAESVLSAK